MAVGSSQPPAAESGGLNLPHEIERVQIRDRQPVIDQIHEHLRREKPDRRNTPREALRQEQRAALTDHVTIRGVNSRRA